jgi:UDP:flavonoid glycosyltransferase YjiC (YdhE family)
MSDILTASVPIHGHVAPLLPLARHFVDRGDTVRFLTGERFAAAVAATGAHHIALPAAADFDDREVTSRYPEREHLSPVKAIAFDFEHIFVRPGEHQYVALTRILQEAPADVVVCDPLFVGSALLVERDLAERVPVVVAGIVPLNVPGPGRAPFGLGLPPLGGIAGRIRNTVLQSATRRVFRPVEAAADEVASRTIRRPLSGPILDWLPRADAVCQFTVPSFEYPYSEEQGRVVFTGPIASSPAGHEVPEWWHELDGTRPVVHVTQGTIANDSLDELVIPTLRALADDDVLVVVATGGTPVSALGELPANARAAEFLPYDDLFPRTAVFVTNGGYGGAQFALRHGVPMVVAPGKEDKVEVAARIAWSHTGVRLRTQRPAPDAVGRAVRAVLADPRYRQAAQRIGAEITDSQGAEGFATEVDRAIDEHRNSTARA